MRKEKKLSLANHPLNLARGLAIKKLFMNNELTTQNFDLAKPEQALKVAELLQRFVKEKKLTANIKGKDYPLVEAWLFAGSQLGLYPILTGIKDLSTPDEKKYMASVEVRRISDDKPLSKGIAICSNKESSKRLFDEYAILSMAQTRAEGKAFRMLLSWIMKAAGFEATPAEEMDFGKPNNFNDIENVPTEGERQILRGLAFSSNLDEQKKEEALAMIEGCGNYGLYEKIKFRLESLQPSIDEVPNPNQATINAHLKKFTREPG